MAELLSIPKSKYVPESPEKPDVHLPKSRNFADIEETAKKTHDWFKQYFAAFDGQASRTSLQTELDTTDELTRAATTASQLQTDAADQTDDTATNLTSPTFYRYLQLMSAWDSSVILGEEETIPVRYDAPQGAEGPREEEAIRMNTYRNAEFAWIMDKAKLRQKIKDIIFFGRKYGNLVLEMYWDRKKETITERIPTYPGVVGKIMRAVSGKQHFTFKEKERVIADWPDIRVRDIRNCWFDLTIDAAQKQSCMIFRDQFQLSELWDDQKRGLYKNLKDLKAAHQYNRDGEDKIQTDRKDNAGMSGDDYNVTKLFDVYSGYIRLPVDPETGKWDETQYLPTWHWVAFIGDVNASPLCVAIRPKPVLRESIPVLIYHDRRDDLGALHVSSSQLTKCLIATEMTLLNLAIDNFRLRGRKPMIGEMGTVMIKDKTFTSGGNRWWWKTRGAQDPHEVTVEDITGNIPTLLELVESRVRDVFGANRAFMAQPSGGRTSAYEAGFITEQAVRVALEEVDYKATQLLPFIAEWSAYFMDQFGDPETMMSIMWEGKPLEFKPADIYGPFKVRVTSLKNFRDNAIKRRLEDEFMIKFYPAFKDIMSTDGRISLASQMARGRGIEGVDKLWITAQDYDARERARRESSDMLFYGMNHSVSQGDNDAVHLQEHKLVQGSYAMLPAEEQNEQNVNMHNMHVKMHENQAQRKQAGMGMAASQQIPTPGAETTAMMPGQAAGEVQAGAMGGMANLPNVEEMATAALPEQPLPTAGA